MKVTSVQEYRGAGHRIEGDGSLVVKSVTTEINVCVNRREAGFILSDLLDIHPSKINLFTLELIAKLKVVLGD